MESNLGKRLCVISQRIIEKVLALQPRIFRTLAFFADMSAVVAAAGFAALLFSPYCAYLYHGRNLQDCDMIEFVSVGSFSNAVTLAAVASVWVFIFGGKNK